MRGTAPWCLFDNLIPCVDELERTLSVVGKEAVLHLHGWFWRRSGKANSGTVRSPIRFLSFSMGRLHSSRYRRGAFVLRQARIRNIVKTPCVSCEEKVSLLDLWEVEDNVSLYDWFDWTLEFRHVLLIMKGFLHVQVFSFNFVNFFENELVIFVIVFVGRG